MRISKKSVLRKLNKITIGKLETDQPPDKWQTTQNTFVGISQKEDNQQEHLHLNSVQIRIHSQPVRSKRENIHSSRMKFNSTTVNPQVNKLSLDRSVSVNIVRGNSVFVRQIKTLECRKNDIMHDFLGKRRTYFSNFHFQKIKQEPPIKPHSFSLKKISDEEPEPTFYKTKPLKRSLIKPKEFTLSLPDDYKSPSLEKPRSRASTYVHY